MTQQEITSGGVKTKRFRAAGIALAALLCVPLAAQALPVFNRQTGQNCVACHAGGQFPELTPYGRMFKMTGYTIEYQRFEIRPDARATLKQGKNILAVHCRRVDKGRYVDVGVVDVK